MCSSSVLVGPVLRDRRAFLAVLVLLGSACDGAPSGGVARDAMGTGSPPPVVGTPSLPAPRVAYLGEIASPDLVSPTRIAVSASDEILVSDALGGAAHVFSARGTPRLRLSAGLSRPLGIGGGAQGQIYVGDADSGAVMVFDGSGRSAGALGAGRGELAMPNDIAVDRTTGTVFVSDSKRDQVRAFASDGRPLGAFGSRGRAPGQLSFPTGILHDGSGGRLFVVDHDSARIQVFTPRGELLSALCGTYSAAPGGLVRPQGIARDALGRLYVADAFVGRVQVLDANGVHIGYVGTSGTGTGEMALPSDVAIDRFGRLLVASYDTGKVLVYGIDDWVLPPGDSLRTEVAISPDVLKREKPRLAVTVYVEVAGRDASEIVVGDAVLHAGGLRMEPMPGTVSVGDRDRDGVRDLKLQISGSGLVAALGSDGRHEVAFASRLRTGERIEGTAVVTVVSKGGKP